MTNGPLARKNRVSPRLPAGLALTGILLAAAGCSAGSSGGGGIKPPPPTITLTLVGPYLATLESNNWVVAGIPGFTLLATGTGFTSASVIQWNGTALATQFGSSTGLAAQVTSAMVATPGTVAITVEDSGTTSNSLPFGIASPAAATAGAVQMITVAPDGSPANANSLVAPAISATGRYVSFQSAATNLVTGHAASGYQEIYERDTCMGAPAGCAPSTIPISVTYDGSPVDGHSRDSSISGDGRYVAFDSSADNILPNGSICASTSCVFLYDTCIGAAAGCSPQMTLISVAADGSTGNGGIPATSPDGRFVAFDSSTGNIAGGNPSGYPNVFLRDTCNGALAGCTPGTVLISQSSTGVIGNQNSHSQAVSTGGRFVAFQSYATNLITDDTNIWSDIFLRDTCTGADPSCVPSTARESVATDGTQGNNSLDYEVVPSISSNGRFIAWASDATNMVTQNVNGYANIYLRDTCFGAQTGCTPTTTLASIGNDGSIPNFGQNNQSMDATGRFIAFPSLASNLVPGDTFTAGAWKDIFVHDTCFGAPSGCVPSTVRVSVANYPGNFATQSNGINDYPQISADGHYVVFLSASTNYLASGGNGYDMVYLALTGF